MLKNLWNYYFGPADEEHMGRAVRVHGPIMHRLTAGYVLLAVGVVAGLFLFQRQADKIEVTANQSHRALCVQKENAQRSIVQTKAYIESDTNGFVFGIPVSVLKRSVKVNQATVAAMSDVDCT